MTQRLQGLVVVITLVLALLGWRAFEGRVEANSGRFADELLAAEATSYTRPVHREPARDGSFGECVEALVPLFSSFGHTVELGWWKEHDRLCFGDLTPAELSEEARARYALFKPLRPQVADCLREAKIAPGRIFRFSEGKDPASAAFSVMNTQMGLSNCGAIIERLEHGDASSALAECADAFAWFRDAAYMGAGHRLGDAESVGLPVVVPCGEAIDVASNEQRAVFAKEIRAIRAGLPTAREMADRQRLRSSLWTYAPFLTPASRARAAAVLGASGKTGESYEDLTDQLAIKARWSSRVLLFREALAEVEKPRSPERQQRLLELGRSVVKDQAAFSTLHQMIGEAQARETVDAALELLVAAAELDLDSPQPLPGSAGFSTEVIEEGIGFRLLVPKPTPVIVVRTRPPGEAQ